MRHAPGFNPGVKTGADSGMHGGIEIVWNPPEMTESPYP